MNESTSGCGTTIDPNQDFRKVVGWERRRDGGGTNALRLRQPQQSGPVASACTARGMAAQQGSIPLVTG